MAAAADGQQTETHNRENTAKKAARDQGDRLNLVWYIYRFCAPPRFDSYAFRRARGTSKLVVGSCRVVTCYPPLYSKLPIIRVRGRVSSPSRSASRRGVYQLTLDGAFYIGPPKHKHGFRSDLIFFAIFFAGLIGHLPALVTSRAILRICTPFHPIISYHIFAFRHLRSRGPVEKKKQKKTNKKSN